MQKKVIKLTNYKNETILIGIESIIDVISENRGDIGKVSVIRSRGAMVETNYIKESIEDIYKLINN
jgi:hypothetical protein